MKKRLIKIFSGLLLGISLFSVPAYANMRDNVGWNVMSRYGNIPIQWDYMYSDGTMAKGWKYINGEWYYFNRTSNFSLLPNVKWNSETNCYDMDTSFTSQIPYSINGKTYCFNSNGAMIHDCWVYLGGNAGIRSWVNSDGCISEVIKKSR